MLSIITIVTFLRCGDKKKCVIVGKLKRSLDLVIQFPGGHTHEKRKKPRVRKFDHGVTFVWNVSKETKGWRKVGIVSWG